jgi:hypothetical protein
MSFEERRSDGPHIGATKATWESARWWNGRTEEDIFDHVILTIHHLIQRHERAWQAVRLSEKVCGMSFGLRCQVI